MNATMMEETLSTIAAMRHQENRAYRVCDNVYETTAINSSKCPWRPASSSSSSSSPVDAECRDKIAAWNYQVLHFLKMNRETVSISMSYLDRYLATPGNGAAARADRSLFRLAAMTALYLAIKLHESAAMNPASICHFSAGAYSVEQLEATERDMLFALRWHVNPPTSLSFARLFLRLLAPDLDDDELRDSVFELTKHQTEVAVRDREFVQVKASTIAFCSMINALELLVPEEKTLERFTHVLGPALGVDRYHETVCKVQNALYHAFLGEQQQQQSSGAAGASSGRHPSSSRAALGRGGLRKTWIERTCVRTSPRSTVTTSF